jgi:hypothetical protein
MLQISALLLHLDEVPASARAALASALHGPAEQRCEHLVAAATILHREVGLDCEDVRELIGLGAGYDCGGRTMQL